ncbi:MAG: TolC family protein [Erysipelotrichia bacterium]|nr:TolC family protein [Erysipelotrichia bacterium]
MKPHRICLFSAFLIISLMHCITAGAAETILPASDTASQSAVVAPLQKFAGLVIEGNRSLLAAGHDLESAMFEKNRALESFSPHFYYSSDASKSANRDYNSLTGIEEDYTTRRKGSGAGISQRTPIGNISYDYVDNKTEYTTSQTSYFKSLYLSVKTGLLRNDARLNSLERRLAHAEYEINQAQTDSLLLDVLLNAFQTLFNRIVAARNQALKKQNLNFYASLVEEAEIKLKNGIGSELDLKQASMRLQQAETGNEETGLALHDNDRQLATQLGRSEWNPEIASFSLESLLSCIPSAISITEFEKTALSRRPDYRVYLSQYKMQRAAFERARELSRPNLAATARWGKQGRGFTEEAADAMADKSWDVAITYSMSLGPEPESLSFSSQREKLKAFEAKLEQKRDDIKIAVAESAERIEFCRRNLASLKASEKLSVEVLEGQRLNFQLGKVSLLDLTRYQQEYDNASLAVVQGETRLIMEWLRLLYVTGTLAEFAKAGTGNEIRKSACNK